MTDAIPDLPVETAQERAEAIAPLAGGQKPLNTRAVDPKPIKMKASSVAIVMGVGASVDSFNDRRLRCYIWRRRFLRRFGNISIG